MTSQRYSLVTYAAYDVYCTNHDWNTLDKILELDAPSYYMMNILDYLDVYKRQALRSAPATEPEE